MYFSRTYDAYCSMYSSSTKKVFCFLGFLLKLLQHFGDSLVLLTDLSVQVVYLSTVKLLCYRLYFFLQLLPSYVEGLVDQK